MQRLSTRTAARPRDAAPTGAGAAAALTRQELFFTLLAGDLDDLSRAALPGGGERRAARRPGADPAPQAARDRAPRARGSPRDFSTALYAATSCEEIPFPWTRFSDPVSRFAEIAAAAAQIPAADLPPLRPRHQRGQRLHPPVPALARGLARARAGPPPPGSLPDVPVLMLSGELDLRTPVEAARGALGDWPRARLLVAPNYGHSVLSADLGLRGHAPCGASSAAGASRRAAAASRPLFAPLPPPPTALRRAALAGGRAAAGTAGWSRPCG